jgi:hypothetical protein
MGLKIVRLGVDRPYTIFDALNEFIKPKEKRTLMLINKATGQGFKVVSYDPVTHIVKLRVGSKKKLLSPRLTAREEALYEPLWR